MRLDEVSIAGFRSYTNAVRLIIDPAVTVILGANDHGKSNLLKALQALNSDTEFTADADLSWDLADRVSEYPQLRYTLSLSVEEREHLRVSENKTRQKLSFHDKAGGVVTREITASAAAPQKRVFVYKNEAGEQLTVDKVVQSVTFDPARPELKINDIPENLTIVYTGVDRKRQISEFDDFDSETVESFVKSNLPRVELVEPETSISDRVTWAEFSEGTNEFMRGIFFYAGLEPDDTENLFEQNDRTLMQLTKASNELNRTLKETWSQGQGLEFLLRHHSATKSIELLIQDPAVKGRYVRASRRSSGFTHYFTLKTILYAREKDYEAKSRIILFDEPGIFLHPSGQFDLLRVLQKLGSQNQIAYVTHSLHMIDKNFPGRHRMLVKDVGGTRVDAKPYSGGWSRALSSLGITLAGSILFANHILLTEGDSDPVYLYAVLGELSQRGKIRMDLNSLAIMATGEGRNAEAIIRMLSEARPTPRIAYLSDADAGGEARLKDIDSVCKVYGVKIERLTKGTSIEDHVIGVHSLLVDASASYANRLLEDRNRRSAGQAKIGDQLRSDFIAAFPSDKVTSGVGNWLTAAIAKVVGLSGDASKVGLAREYATILTSEVHRFDAREIDRAARLAERIQKLLEIPDREADDQTILET